MRGWGRDDGVGMGWVRRQALTVDVSVPATTGIEDIIAIAACTRRGHGVAVL